jgi:hypothetical protein
LYVDGKKITEKYNLDGIEWDPTDPKEPKLKVTSFVDGETWAIDIKSQTFGSKDKYFDVIETGKNIGSNSANSTGLWGDSVGGGDTVGNAGKPFDQRQKGGGGEKGDTDHSTCPLAKPDQTSS